jgi:hypothetical protein
LVGEAGGRSALVCWYCVNRPQLLTGEQFVLPPSEDSFMTRNRKSQGTRTANESPKPQSQFELEPEWLEDILDKA